MSTGRGRGYTGRHHLRRPGDADDARLAELSPPANLSKFELNMEAKKEMEIEKEMQKEEKVREPVKQEIKHHVGAEDDIQLKELLTIDEQYAPLIALLEQFSPGEDGIQFNRKLRHFETTVTNLCPDEARLQQAFSTFRSAALQSAVTARKLAAVGASFTRQQRQQLLRGALLNVVMQGTFSKLDLLERANPTYLINAANLMGDYFAEARLCNGNKVHILASPLLHYMRALLASDDIRAHRSLATQLMQNGRELLSVLAVELDELSISVRLRLLRPPPVSLVWLLLSADLCLNKFLPLPTTLQQFYAAHLELSSDESYSEVSYGSWKKPDQEDYRSDSSDMADKVSQNISQISLNQDEDPKPKLRPILGAGATLLRQEQAVSISQDTFDSWTTKSSLTKRYDLNSWRQNEEEKTEDNDAVFNPTVLPPNIPNYPVTVPDYPPPNVRYNNFQQQENFVNYLQQGDGAYIQTQYQNNPNYTPQGDFVPEQNLRQSFEKENTAFPQEKTQDFVPQYPSERPVPERVNNEVQKNANRQSRPVENWRKEKSDSTEDTNKNRPKNWTRQRSKDNTDEEEKELDKFKNRTPNIRPPSSRLNRRNSSESTDTINSGTGVANPAKPVPRRHVTEVPRNHKYWDHDDRCDKDYNS